MQERHLLLLPPALFHLPARIPNTYHKAMKELEMNVAIPQPQPQPPLGPLGPLDGHTVTPLLPIPEPGRPMSLTLMPNDGMRPVEEVICELLSMCT